MKRLTEREKEILRMALYSVESTIERDNSEPEDSSMAYQGNYLNFNFTMSKEENNLFKSAMSKLSFVL